ncbi:hypothetical protein B484DRAFT_395225 [Ochromonadaceae sp. CCMP2298]|nr:hypothetical protein B484DRAFT_395225 [Ochromonadaceae sp. CCMP2298]
MGCLVCKVLKIADRSFTAFDKKPKVLKMKDSNHEKLYVMLYQYGMEDSIVEEAMYKKCIEPEVLAHRASVLSREHCEVMSSQSQVESQQSPEKAAPAAQSAQSSSSRAQEDGESDDEDGDGDENDFVVDQSSEGGPVPAPESEGLKGWGAMFCYGEHWGKLKEILKENLDPASFKSVWKCMQASQDLLSKAFQPLTIRSAYKKSGVWPFQPLTILNKCPRFSELKQYQCKRVLASIEEFADIMYKGKDEHGKDLGKGKIFEADYIKILGGAIDNTPPKTGKAVDKMAPLRQRACIVNHDVFQEEYAEMEVEKVTQKEATATKKRVREEAAAGEGERAAMKKKKVIECSNPSCGVIKDSECSNACEWTKCDKLKCTLNFCPGKQCQKQGEAHAKICKKAVRVVKFKKEKAPKKSKKADENITGASEPLRTLPGALGLFGAIRPPFFLPSAQPSARPPITHHTTTCAAPQP